MEQSPKDEKGKKRLSEVEARADIEKEESERIEVTVKSGNLYVDGRRATPDWQNRELIVSPVIKDRKETVAVTEHYGDERWDTGRTIEITTPVVVAPEYRLPMPDKYGFRVFDLHVQFGYVYAADGGPGDAIVARNEKEIIVAVWGKTWRKWVIPKESFLEQIDIKSFKPQSLTARVFGAESPYQEEIKMAALQKLHTV